MQQALGLLVLILVPGACNPQEAVVGKARLAMADGTVPAADGPVVEVPGAVVKGDFSGPVRLAADSEVSVKHVFAAAKAIEKAGGKPVYLVARRTNIEAIEVPPIATSIPPDAMRLDIRVDGQPCISQAKTPREAACIERVDRIKHVDRVGVRKLIFKGTREWGLKKVHLVVTAPDLNWADMVRAIDGVQTCCDADKVELTREP